MDSRRRATVHVDLAVLVMINTVACVAIKGGWGKMTRYRVVDVILEGH